MGLLDEAIRDHLELKRRRGADPSEIARAEHEALEPIFPPEGEVDRESDAEAATAAGGPPTDLEGPAVPDGAVAPPEAAVPSEAVSLPPDASAVAQDTAELDMEAVLQEDSEVAVEPSAASIDEELLEWETPTRASQPGEDVNARDRDHAAEGEEVGVADQTGSEVSVDPEIPGQERLTFE